MIGLELSLYFITPYFLKQYISFLSFLGLKKKKAPFNCKQLCSAEVAKVIILLHFNTGADAVTGFFGQGKISVWCKVEKRIQEAISLLNGQQGVVLKVVRDFIFTASFVCFYLIKKLLHKYFGYHDLLLLLLGVGLSLPLSQDVKQNLEKFTIKFVYGDMKSESLAACRALKWSRMKKK